MDENCKLLLARSDLKAGISEVEIVEAGHRKDRACLSGCVWKCVIHGGRAHSADSNADIFDCVSFHSLVPYMTSIQYTVNIHLETIKGLDPLNTGTETGPLFFANIQDSCFLAGSV